jgi:hypothetical protein
MILDDFLVWTPPYPFWGVPWACAGQLTTWEFFGIPVYACLDVPEDEIRLVGPSETVRLRGGHISVEPTI